MSATRGPLTPDRLAVHTITTKPWPLEQAIAEYAQRGLGGISVWLEALEGISTRQASRWIEQAGLRVPALVRGGFFTAADKSERLKRVEENRRHLETTAAIGAEMVVLVVGATPKVPLVEQRRWVAGAIAELLPEAERLGVKLAIEPLHPMYSADRSCINRIAEARAICEELDHPLLGVAVDVYHVWWDPDLETEVRALGSAGRLFGFHICDWRTPTRDLVNDRELMGCGCIELPGIRRLVESAGFQGLAEVEIFSHDYWSQDQGKFLDNIIQAAHQHA